ncbi:glycosyltransferase family 4 protein [Gloeomargarita lithophora]|uniref:glycosyltransferase family 4 protein n=1 Tax=Gloeomargarita lithophora TaxID=1188228 RepID=UPI001C12BD82|nr:glycosyltransferase family 4 protein [Gloeomargarita lithophora]
MSVITMRSGVLNLRENITVYSLGKELDYSEPHRAMRFYRFLYEILQSKSIHLCFSHMTPVFTNLAAPILKILGIPVVTWYAHPSLTNNLKLAHKLSNKMVTSIPTAYPYRHDKLVVVGQGIDTHLFTPSRASINHKDPLILAVGRLSPVKDYSTLIRAVTHLISCTNHRIKLLIVGNPTSTKDEHYVQLLHQQVQELNLASVVTFQPAVSMYKLPDIYRQCTVYVNLTPTGFGDKVALEAMACGKVCLAANTGFRETLGIYAEQLLFNHADSQDLAEKLAYILSLSDEQRQAMGNYLRQQIIHLHSLERLINNLLQLFRQLTHA